MERKKFIREGVGGLIGLATIVPILDACKKNDIAATNGSGTTTGSTSGSCIVSPTETEGPYPYPGGELTNPLQRVIITSNADGSNTQTGVPLGLTFTVVNTNSSCAAVTGARVDIWHCNKDGYYSGYANQPGINGTQSYTGAVFLRGYQTSDADGKVQFTTIYPGWYAGRATHIHFEVYVNNIVKKTGQVTFLETISDAVHVSTLYAAHGVNTTRNASDSVFGDSATDLANEIMVLTGSIAAGYTGTYTIGLAL
jgi:protocatechuate 3,4-dioxygenase beta subunit